MDSTIYYIGREIHTNSTDLTKKSFFVFDKYLARSASRESFCISKRNRSYDFSIAWSIVVMIAHSLSGSNSLQTYHSRRDGKHREYICSFFIHRILGMKRIVPIQSQSRPICIEEIISNFEHRCTIANMPSHRRKPRIQNFVIHTFKRLNLLRNSGIRKRIRIKKMRQHSFNDKIRMTLQLFYDM